MKKILIVVDMQNDFINGSLGTKEAVAIVPNVEKKIKEYKDDGQMIVFTQDTHFKNYMGTFEGKHLPVEHCIKDTDGWRIAECLEKAGKDCEHIEKNTFGYEEWKKFKLEQYDVIEVIGLCTDICVISNALAIRMFYPEEEIVVDAGCCAGVTPEKHKAALEVMKSCQITVIDE